MPGNEEPIKPGENTAKNVEEKVNKDLQAGIEAARKNRSQEELDKAAKYAANSGSNIQGKNSNSAENSSGSNTNNSNSDTKTGDGVEKKQTPIINFTKLVLGTAFQEKLRSPFLKPGYMSLLEAIKSLLNFTYYNIYTVPNLQNNNCILIKPETFFVMIPKCNVILPSIKHGVSYNLNSKYAPTRVLFITDPMQVTEKKYQTLKLATVAAIKCGGSNPNLSGDIDILASNIGKVEQTNADSWPVYTLTDYEERFGPRIYNDMGGGDLLAYIEAYSAGNDDVKTAEVTEAVENLAKYTLLKARYIDRAGNVSMYFNPYIIPGFPLAILEDKSVNSSATNIYGYVTAVIHSITANGWNTSVAFNAATIDGEVRPDAFPIAEEDYKPGNISGTYAKLLGASDCYDTQSISSTLSKETKDSFSVTESLNFIKRPLTTLKEFLTSMTGSSSDPVVKNNVMRIESSMYRTSIQKIIIEYSESILDTNKHFALHTGDIR